MAAGFYKLQEPLVEYCVVYAYLLDISRHYCIVGVPTGLF